MRLAPLQHGRDWLAHHGLESRLYLRNNLDGLASGALIARRAASEISFATPFQGPLDRTGPIVVVAQGIHPVKTRAAVLYVDHHPEPAVVDATVVWDDSVEATSLLAWRLLGAPLELEWLSALGVLGNRAAAGTDPEALERVSPELRRVATLCAAAARLRGGPLTAAFSMLRDATGPADALGRPAARRLVVARQQLEDLALEAARYPPRIGPTAAVVEIDIPALVHPQLAAVWARRLAPLPVLVANRGWRAHGVAYSLRCADPRALKQWADGVAAQTSDPDGVSRCLSMPEGGLSLTSYRTLLRAIEPGQPADR